MERPLTCADAVASEASSNHCAIGETASPSPSRLARPHLSFRSRPPARRSKKCGLALGGHGQTARAKGGTRAQEPRSAFLFVPLGARAPRHRLAARRPGRWGAHRVMDLRAECPGKLAALSCPLSPPG